MTRTQQNPLFAAFTMHTLMQWTLPVLALLGAGACSPAGKIFEPLDEPLRWPPPPEPPRVEYVGELATSKDLKPAKSFVQGLGEALFGKEAARSMLTPYAVCTHDDRVFVADSNAQTVHVFNLESRRYTRWEPITNEGEAEVNLFSQPVGIAFDPLNRLLVADSVVGAIFAFERNGEYLGRLGEQHLQRPCGLAVDHDRRRIYVADTGTHQVLALAVDGEMIERIGERGGGPGQFNYPTNVAVDSVGRLYVSDTLNFRVQVFSPDLEPLWQIGSKGDLPGYFSLPKDVAVDNQDRVYVVDAHFESVQIFDPHGRLLLPFGEEGSGPGQFWLPAGIHVDADNRVWVADSYNRRIQVFDVIPETQP